MKGCSRHLAFRSCLPLKSNSSSWFRKLRNHSAWGRIDYDEDEWRVECLFGLSDRWKRRYCCTIGGSGQRWWSLVAVWSGQSQVPMNTFVNCLVTTTCKVTLTNGRVRLIEFLVIFSPKVRFNSFFNFLNGSCGVTRLMLTLVCGTGTSTQLYKIYE